MNKTSIEWVKNPDGTQGCTWNPLTGCLNHDNGLCKGGGFPCYAYRLANTRLRERYLANKNYMRPLPEDANLRYEFLADLYDDPFYPRFWTERITEPWPPKGKPKGYFVCDMSDLFGIGVPEEWTAKVLKTIAACEHDRFYLLTKQPQNLAKFSPFPDNCFVGVTATNSDMARRGMTELDFIIARIKFLSIEPLLDNEGYTPWKYIAFDKVNWLIIGAQTKPYKPPKIEDVWAIAKAADKAGIPVFLKNNLKPLIDKPFEAHTATHRLVEDESMGGGHYEIRQEMPV